MWVGIPYPRPPRLPAAEIIELRHTTAGDPLRYWLPDAAGLRALATALFDRFTTENGDVEALLLLECAAPTGTFASLAKRLGLIAGLTHTEGDSAGLARKFTRAWDALSADDKLRAPNIDTAFVTTLIRGGDPDGTAWSQALVTKLVAYSSPQNRRRYPILDRRTQSALQIFEWMSRQGDSRGFQNLRLPYVLESDFKAAGDGYGRYCESLTAFANWLDLPGISTLGDAERLLWMYSRYISFSLGTGPMSVTRGTPTGTRGSRPWHLHVHRMQRNVRAD